MSHDAKICSFTQCDQCGGTAEVLFCEGPHGSSQEVRCESCGWWEVDDFDDDE